MRVALIGLLVFAGLAAGSWWLFQHLRAGRGGLDAAVASPVPVPPSSDPVRLVIPRGTHWFAVNWGVVLVLLGLALLDDPKLLWTAWLSVPAGALLLLLGGGLVWTGWPQPDGLLQVGPQGLRREIGAQVDERSWAQVQALHRYTTSHGLDNQHTQHHWVVVDDQGAWFLHLEAPLEPAAEWQRLQLSIEAWSGRRWTPQRPAAAPAAPGP